MARHLPTATIAILALTTSACASGGSSAPPSYAAVSGTTLPASGRLYVDCIRAAIDSRTVDRVGSRIRFTCRGPAAEALYQGLGPHSAAIGSAFQHQGLTYRPSTVIERDLEAADLCRSGPGTPAVCDLHLTAGEILDTPAEAVPAIVSGR